VRKKKGSRPPPTAPSSEIKTGFVFTDFDKQKVGRQFLILSCLGGEDISPASIA